MNDEFDYELTLDQWEALKALRAPAANPSRLRRSAVESLITLGLVATRDDSMVITPAGRKVLIRGSSQLLHDVAA
jgi:ribosomal protein S19E (S16A)